MVTTNENRSFTDYASGLLQINHKLEKRQWRQNTKGKLLASNRCLKYMPMFLIEGNLLHAELDTNKYRDYIYDRITGNCLSNLSVDFMRKKEECKVMILEYMQWFSNIVNNTEEKLLLKILLIH